MIILHHMWLVILEYVFMFLLVYSTFHIVKFFKLKGIKGISFILRDLGMVMMLFGGFWYTTWQVVGFVWQAQDSRTLFGEVIFFLGAILYICNRQR